MNKADYAVSGNPKRVAVHPGQPDPVPAPTKVEFTDLTANGEDGVTTSLTLAFGSAVVLSPDDIYLNPGSTGAEQGALNGNGTSYTLGVNNIAAAGDVSVTVTKAGYAFNLPVKDGCGAPLVPTRSIFWAEPF